MCAMSHPRAAAVPWSVLLRRDWDQLLQALFFVIYGVWGGLTTVRLPDFQPLYGLLIFFDVEFIAIGAMLVIGLRMNSWSLRRRAYLIYAGALGLFAALLLTSSPTPFAALSLGFAVQGIVTARILHRQEQLALKIFKETAFETEQPKQAWELGRHRQS
jgi:hypothetical protein